ncbi:response regulator [Bacillus sp. DJP31]|uniref:response regulator n=1 Tax=Bacillus sp. DJP31 TaxID=3409789 RepID=UPI003BB598BD
MNKTVLIADDSLFMRTRIKSILERNGYVIISEASNGEEAFEKYKLHHPDILLLDISMPKINGLQALKQIIHYHSDAVVIMFSALGQKTLIIDALQAGAKDFIVKPNFEQIIPVLNKFN